MKSSAITENIILTEIKKRILKAVFFYSLYFTSIRKLNFTIFDIRIFYYDKVLKFLGGRMFEKR